MHEVAFKTSQVLFEAGQPITHIYFPLTGIVSLIVADNEGSSVEVATIGNEGIVGLGGLLAGDVSFSRQIVQLPGRGICVGREGFLTVINESHRVRDLLAAHVDAFTAQLLQSAACNARHDAEQRLARWVLTVSDRSGLSSLPFTQHQVAELLGVQRPTITLVTRVMQTAGLIEHRRGVVTVIDRPGLEEVACECYDIIRDAYDNAIRRAIGGAA